MHQGGNSASRAPCGGEEQGRRFWKVSDYLVSSDSLRDRFKTVANLEDFDSRAHMIVEFVLAFGERWQGELQMPRCLDSAEVDVCKKMEIDQQEVDEAKAVHELIRGASLQVEAG